MTDAQELTLRRLCAGYKVEFHKDDYHPQFDLPADYVAGWIGGNDGRRPLYVGVDGEGNARRAVPYADRRRGCTWADGYGTWHASVRGLGSEARKRAADEIHAELLERSPRGMPAPRPEVELVSWTARNFQTRSEWKEV